MEADPNFEGFPGSDCGEHRTVGPHRAWCYACTTWCYPDVPCPGCHVPILEAEVERLRGVVEAAEKLHALHVKRDQMIENDTWEADGAVPTWRALANAEKRLGAALGGEDG